ncbi:hypothetical protein [Variovorax sp. GB1P17]|uniref:hypothetical protein n=1 Tax=Variovorax sp. GB1P17 TaxID=3443740 RepID=UPI003F458622
MLFKQAAEDMALNAQRDALERTLERMTAVQKDIQVTFAALKNTLKLDMAAILEGLRAERGAWEPLLAAIQGLSTRTEAEWKSLEQRAQGESWKAIEAEWKKVTVVKAWYAAQERTHIFLSKDPVLAEVAQEAARHFREKNRESSKPADENSRESSVSTPENARKERRSS